MIKGLNIFLPTRGRPKRLAKFLDSMHANADDADRLHVVFVVDKGDKPTPAVIGGHCKCSHQVLVNESPKPHLAKFYNRCYSETIRNSDEWAVSMFGDDMVFVSDGWDTRFIETLNRCNGKAIVYGDDDYIQHERLPVHFVTSRALVKATKRPFMAKWYAADMIDTVWREVGRKAGLLRYLADVHIRHEHNGQLLPVHRDETFKRLQTVKLPRREAYIQVEKISNAIVKNLKESKYV